MTLSVLFAVALGGGLGAVCRAACTNLIKTRWKRSVPLATFCINVSGSFALGLLGAAALSAPLSALLGTGFLGGFTTFSTLHVEALTLLRGEAPAAGIGYLCASYGCGIAAAAPGLTLGAHLL